MIRNFTILFVACLIALSPVWGQGSGNALKFDGTNDFVNLTNVGNNLRSIELWFKPDVTINSTNIIADPLIFRDWQNNNANNFDEFGIYIEKTGTPNPGKLVFFRKLGNNNHQVVSDNNVWYAGYWYHVAATIHPTTGMKLWINGVLQADTNTSVDDVINLNISNNNNTTLGRWGWYTNGPYFDGEIDEVRLWTTGLDQAYVQDYMCQKLTGNETGLKAYYTANVNTNNTLNNVAGGGFNGTLQSGTTRPVSGAAIGDTSVFVYNTNWAGQNLSLDFGPGDSLSLHSITTSSAGVHIYRENTLPNTTSGMANPGVMSSYYGTFFTDTSANYSIAYNYDNFTNDCSQCSSFYTRNDNARSSWTPSAATMMNCIATKSGESDVGSSRRAEYFAVPEISFSNVDLGPDSTLCEGDTIFLDAYTLGATYLWQDNTTDTGMVSSSTGTYWVEVSVGNCSVSDTVEYIFETTPFFSLGSDILICPGDSINWDITFPGASYVWQDNSTLPTHTAILPQVYAATSTLGNCTWTDTVDIGYIFIPVLDIGPDTTVCDSVGYLLNASTPTSTYLWQDGSTSPFFSPTVSGIYSVSVTFNAGCLLVDSADITINPTPIFTLGNDTTICPGETLIIDATYPSGTYEWQDMSTNPTFTVSTAGAYFVEISVSGCSSIEAKAVNYVTDPNLELGADVAFCDGNVLNLDVTTTNASYLWNNGDTVPTYSSSVSELITIQMTLDNCVFSDSLALTVNPIPVIDLGANITVCPWVPIPLDASYPGATYTWNDNSTGAIYNVIDSGQYSVLVNALGCTYEDTININHFDIPVLNLGSDTVLCSGFPYTLDVTQSGATYLWHDGHTGSTYTPNITGQYSVTVDLNQCPVSDEILVDLLPTPNVDLGPDVVICETESYLIDATTPSALYTWQDLSTGPTFIATEEGTYWVELSFGLCSGRDSVFVGVTEVPTVSLGEDTSLCEGQTLPLSASYPGATYLWQDGSTISSYVVNTPGLYNVQITSGPCVTNEDIIVTYIATPGFDLGRDTNLCQGTTLPLKAEFSTDDVGFSWQNGSNLDSFLVFEPGIYSLQTNRQQCTWNDSIKVTYTLLPEVNGGSDTTLCQDESTILTVRELSGQGNIVDYLWSDQNGEITNKEAIRVTETGQYTIEATNDCGVGSDVINVQFVRCECNIYAPNAFTPNDDKVNDFFKLEAYCDFNLFDLTIFDRYGQQVFHTNDPNAQWDGKVKGRVLEGTTFVWVLEYKALDDGKNSKKKRFGKVVAIR